jgi:hypothetical protein
MCEVRLTPVHALCVRTSDQSPAPSLLSSYDPPCLTHIPTHTLVTAFVAPARSLSRSRHNRRTAASPDSSNKVCHPHPHPHHLCFLPYPKPRAPKSIVHRMPARTITPGPHISSRPHLVYTVYTRSGSPETGPDLVRPTDTLLVAEGPGPVGCQLGPTCMSSQACRWIPFCATPPLTK